MRPHPSMWTRWLPVRVRELLGAALTDEANTFTARNDFTGPEVHLASSTVNTQGIQFAWNLSTGWNNGQAVILNHRGLGVGGIEFRDTNDATAGTTLARLDTAALAVPTLVLGRNLGTEVVTDTSTGTVNALSGSYGLVRCTGAAVTLRGISATGSVAGRVVVWFQNAGTIDHLAGTASAANRISTPSGASVAVTAGQAVEFVYDPTSAVWRPIL